MKRFCSYHLSIRAHLFAFRLYSSLSRSLFVNRCRYTLAVSRARLKWNPRVEQNSLKKRTISEMNFRGSTRFIRVLIDSNQFQNNDHLVRKRLDIWRQEIGDRQTTSKMVLEVTPIGNKQVAQHTYYTHKISSYRLTQVSFNGQVFFTEHYFVNQDLWSDPQLDSSYGILNPVFAGFEKGDLIVGQFKTPKIEYKNATYVNIFGRYLNNYWHFLCEYLPKLQKVQIGEIVIIPSNLSDTFKCVLISILEKISISHVVVPKFGANFSAVKFIESPVSKLKDGTYSFDPTAIQWIRKLLLASFNLSPAGRTNSSEEVYFFSRKSPRRIIIDKQLQSRMSSNNIIILNPFHLSIQQQIRIFMTAKAVIGYPGANWANLLFARKNLRVFNLVIPGNSLNSLHHTMGIISNSEVIEVLIGPLKSNSLEDVSYSSIDNEGIKISTEIADLITNSIVNALNEPPM